MTGSRDFSPSPITPDVSLERAREWAAMEDRDVPNGGAIGHRAWAMAVNERNALARRVVELEDERASFRGRTGDILARNTRVLPGKEFVGEWVAVPEEDFAAARERFATLIVAEARLAVANDKLARIEATGFDWTEEYEALRCAVRRIFPLSENEGYEAEDEGRADPMFRIAGEDGDPLIEAETAVEALDDLHAHLQEKWEQVERLISERDAAVAIAREAVTAIGRCCDSAGCEADDDCVHAAPFRALLAQIGGKDGK